MLGRRGFITLLGGAAAWPLAARAQQAPMRQIGVLNTRNEEDPEFLTRFATFQEELQKAGWTEGRNLRFERRMSAIDPDSLRSHAAELAALSPDVIVTASNLATTIMSRQTRTIPIVFLTAGDPVGTGLVANMAHPGGNVTGFAGYEVSIAGKWLELLKETSPDITRAAAIYTEGGAGSQGLLHTVEVLAPSFGLRTTAIPAHDAAQIDRAIAAFAGEPNGGLIVLSGPSVSLHRRQITVAAARERLPAIYPFRYEVAEGGLMSYGSDLSDLYRRAAGYVDRILRGEKPGDLPVQVPTRFELAINLKAAKAIGLAVPASLLARADEVIE